VPGRLGFGVLYASAVIALLVLLVAAAPLATAGEAGRNDKLPRFVSLRSDQVNLRVGPGGNYPIEWVLTRKEMPVEMLREFEHWRMIRDWQGTEGWVHERMVTFKRSVIVKGEIRTLRHRPDPASSPVARAEPGVIARLLECQGPWCRIEAGNVTGWVQRSGVWGVYPDETVQ
jgi:SH3-like domain-containing protein